VGQTISPDAPREICQRCRRPTRVCFCDRLLQIPSKTHVVFIQHPLESRVAISTCRMAHLSLPNSELHVALNAEDIPRLVATLKEPGTALLFPADDATDVEALQTPPKTLVVVDGTWDNAKKLFQRSPLLKALPRIGFVPPAPGNYRIRKEPAEHCLSTIEAIAQVLEKLERAPGRFTPMLAAFDRMVDLQLGFIERHDGKSRYEHPRRRNVIGRSPLARLKEVAPNLVVTFAEANAWPRDAAPVDGYAELLQLVAHRLSDGARFEALLKPISALSPAAPLHLGVSADELLNGEDRVAAIARWKSFVKPDDVITTWGRYPIDLLRGEGVAPAASMDLRAVLSQQLHRRPGAVADAGTGPRALRRLAALVAVAHGLLAPPQS
jgi:DTW domain-containing protein YfiP